jgi:hypothetical protein
MRHGRIFIQRKFEGSDSGLFFRYCFGRTRITMKTVSQDTRPINGIQQMWRFYI